MNYLIGYSTPESGCYLHNIVTGDTDHHPHPSTTDSPLLFTAADEGGYLIIYVTTEDATPEQQEAMKEGTIPTDRPVNHDAVVASGTDAVEILEMLGEEC